MKNKIYAFETDTVWGLGCNPCDEEAVNRIYEIKGRDRSKPLILMSNKFENLLKYTKNISPEALKLAGKYLPGALTIIVEKSDICPQYICANFNTVGLRVPNHKGFQELCQKIKGNVLATTSANFSNDPPCADYQEVKNKLGKYVDFITPSVQKPENTASTVVLTVGGIKILRQGSIKL